MPEHEVAQMPMLGGTTVKLDELVKPVGRRVPRQHDSSSFFISVLHLISEGVVDFDGIMTYAPVTPGFPVYPGEVILSKINPRIPRSIVVPDLGRPLLCSTEFEIFQPTDGVSPYALVYLLLHPYVQQQVRSLTAGTSASHSRVKSERLYELEMPWPSAEEKDAFDKLCRNYQSVTEDLVRDLRRLRQIRHPIDPHANVAEPLSDAVRHHLS
jgi:hypothetical protein